jgi:hypothetical protein
MYRLKHVEKNWVAIDFWKIIERVLIIFILGVEWTKWTSTHQHTIRPNPTIRLNYYGLLVLIMAPKAINRWVSYLKNKKTKNCFHKENAMFWQIMHYIGRNFQRSMNVRCKMCGVQFWRSLATSGYHHHHVDLLVFVVIVGYRVSWKIGWQKGNVWYIIT